jgi:hypothetical protein
MAGTNGNGVNALSPELIAKLMASGRTRNSYEPKLKEFQASDEPAVNVREQWSVEFTGKKVTALYQGFRNVIQNIEDEEVRDNLMVKQMDNDVFLIDRAKAAAVVLADQS